MGNIPLNDIYQQKLNFLIGAGASSGLFPTLWLALKDSDDATKEETIETLATKLDLKGYKSHHTLLFMYYYKKIIEPVSKFRPEDVFIQHAGVCSKKTDCEGCITQEKHRKVIDNYEVFIDSIVRVLQQKSTFSKRCNLFTTNYDGCIPLVADRLIKKGGLSFCINDGSSGFLEKTLVAKNFNTYLCESGVFGKHSTDIPQINFINLHGSACWRKNGHYISVDYSATESNVNIPNETDSWLSKLDSILNDSNKNTSDVYELKVELSDEQMTLFWTSYNKLPIVNPTKWKFHETVFEEHYYQMLRLLSYQLEEPNSVLISFAFSFADEHILNLVIRSLSNPRLQVFICCFNEKERISMDAKFKGFKNVTLVFLEDNLDFSKFNETVFNADILRDND